MFEIIGILSGGTSKINGDGLPGTNLLAKSPTKTREENTDVARHGSGDFWPSLGVNPGWHTAPG